MLQATTIPNTPEEIAESVKELDRDRQCIVKGFIAGLRESCRLKESRSRDAGNGQQQTHT